MSETIKAQYRILAGLRRVDEKILRLQDEVKRVPEATAKLDTALSARRESFTKIKSEFDIAEKKLRALEMEIKERDDKILKAEGKMMEVKTNEEYQAAIKENDGQKKEKATIEEQVLKLMNDTEEKRKFVKEHESEFKKFETELLEEKRHLESDRMRFMNQLEEQLQKRTQASTQLDISLIALYNRMALRGKGAAVVLVENGVCMGCNTKVRPQLYNEVLGFKAIHQCPSCGRILLSSVIDGETAAESA